MSIIQRKKYLKEDTFRLTMSYIKHEILLMFNIFIEIIMEKDQIT